VVLLVPLPTKYLHCSTTFSLQASRPTLDSMLWTQRMLSTTLMATGPGMYSRKFWKGDTCEHRHHENHRHGRTVQMLPHPKAIRPASLEESDSSSDLIHRAMPG
jgi:hypothetical protein